MITFCIENLNQIKCLTNSISNEDYRKPINVLSNSSVGQHVRHSLEFYLCLINGLDKKVINYDERKRQLEIETFPRIVSQVIEDISNKLNLIDKNEKLEIRANYTSDENDEVCMRSSLYRELGYCLEHCIHHQALVKCGLLELKALHLIPKDFGIAPSTLRHQKQCAQ